MSYDYTSNRRQFLIGSSAAGLAFALSDDSYVAGQTPTKTPQADASDASFSTSPIPRLKVEIADSELQKLRQNPRAYVHAKLIENEKTEYHDVGVKCKGAAGSFRGVDDRPALTVNLNKYVKKQTFHSLTKIHLNNSVQDPSYLHELISSDLFLAAGVPTARATHARVWVNNRDLGFYGLKEGYDKTFLKRHYANPTGNLYDGGFCQDLDGNLEKDTGDGPNDKSDLKALIQACREGDPMKRIAALSEVLDLENFFRFMALERMTCHWDGYCNNRNNYRVYFDPKTKKAYFIPHGMDQMFGDLGTPVFNYSGGMVVNATMQNMEWRARYREIVNELIKLLSPADRWIARIDQVQARIQPVLAAFNQNMANDQANHAKGLKDRLIARGKNLEMQAATSEPLPLKFDAQGVAVLPKWYSRSETGDAKQEEANGPDNVRSYLVACGPSGRVVASWRTKVLLAAGSYKFQARVRTADVVALPDSPGVGAGVRISGGQRTNKVEGNSNWQVVEQQIDIGNPQQEVELVAELRATKGQAWFDAGAMKLVKAMK